MVELDGYSCMSFPLWGYVCSVIFEEDLNTLLKIIY